MHFKAAVARFAPRLLGLQYAGGTGVRIQENDNDLVTFGQLSDKLNRKRGVLTELELEENDGESQTNMIRNRNH